jgi:hypothetical protein
VFSFFSLLTLFSDISDDALEGIWQQALDVFRGAILADWYANQSMLHFLSVTFQQFGGWNLSFRCSSRRGKIRPLFACFPGN